jgi:class 3 adenylate cyclase
LPDAEPLTLERLLALHPWEREPDSVDRPLEWLWSFDLAANAADLWDLMIDTSRFNRALGLNRMEFTERDGLLHGVGRNGGFRQEWVEIPWDWVSERWLVARRTYSKGFARFARVIYRLQRLDADRTRVWVYFGWIPRGWFGRTCIKLGMPSIERGYRKLLEQLAGAVGDEAPAPYRAPAPALSQEARDRIGSLGRQLIERGLPEDAVDRLVAYVSSADDMDVYRIQLRRLAHRWGIDDERLLRTALHATRLGLLDMSWDVICPHCRGVREEARTLGDVPERGECAVCNIDFDTDSEAALEITFHVHPSIREVPKLYFCSAEPSTKAHIALQLRVAPGDEQVVETSMLDGRYRLRRKGDKEYGFVDVDPDGGAAALRWPASALPDTVRLAPRPSLTLVNDTDDEVTFVVEEVAWTDDALRPVDLFNLQEFRDLFSEEYVATDVQLSVGEQTVLFTDIVGSTRFYADRGDPGAFMEVKKHFVEVYEEVRNHHGAVVKTIGDAAMASFSNPVEALKASLAIHRRFHAGRDDTPIRLRISLNTGPCIAVRLNSNIDYFGTTVNVAAKLQACCEAGEIALAQATYEAPGVRDYLASVNADLNELTYEVKALGQTVQVWQWDTN